VIHRLDEMGLGCVHPQWAVVAVPTGSVLTTRRSSSRRAPPAPNVGHPFTRWTVRKLADYLAHERSAPGCRRPGNGCGSSCARTV
jgi:hypothetical protein